MTAFEILLNKFYDTIEHNRPDQENDVLTPRSSELSVLIREYIDTSFNFGEHLSYRDVLSSIIERSGQLLRNTTQEEWHLVKSIFTENDLHIIRRDRARGDVQKLKNRLDRIFLN